MKLTLLLYFVFLTVLPNTEDSRAPGPDRNLLLNAGTDAHQDELDRGRSLRSRRLFDEASDTFNAILENDPLHTTATFELAETHFQAHRWREAMEWFDAVTLLDPQRREAFQKRWDAIIFLSAGDALLERAATNAVRREIADFLKRYPWDWETLETALRGAETVGDSLLAQELVSRILMNYPNSPAGYRIISGRFYRGLYPIWGDNPRKIDYLGRFLDEYPRSDFRETAWLHLVDALSQPGNREKLRLSLNEWMTEDPDNPLPCERTVHYLLDAGVSADSLLPLARLAVDKTRGWRGKSLKHVSQRIAEGKKLYADTRLNMARILVELDRLAEARLWLQDGIRNNGFGVDDDGTAAPLEYYLGVLEEKAGNDNEALGHYIRALILGDAAGLWSARADSAASRLYAGRSDLGTQDLLSYARQCFGYEGPVFEDVTEVCGLSGVKVDHIAWGDADGDGFDDLLLGGNRLFMNRAGEVFDEITENCGLQARGAKGGVWADADLDGDLDLYCSGIGDKVITDYLFLNQGNDREGTPQFLDVSLKFNILGDRYTTEAAAWGDLQGDGRPDLYVANGARRGEGTPDFLYVNAPDPGSPFGFRFEQLGPDSGLKAPFGENLCGRSVNWGDFDNDGDQDIYVSNAMMQENLLWENLGNDQLDSRACYYGVAGIDHDMGRGHTIGSQWGDFDNDGDLDLILANQMYPGHIGFSDRTMLYENRLAEEGMFADVRRDWKIKVEEKHADPAWGDVDADGDLDLYLTSERRGRSSFLYLNDLENRRFHDRSYLAGLRTTNAMGCAFSDFDNDGDLDLAVGSTEGIRLFRNKGNDHHWLEVELRVPGSGYGTRIRCQQGDRQQLRELCGGKGTFSQHSQVIYFGLGRDSRPVDLEITFPSGEKGIIKRLEVDRKITSDEP